MKLILTRTSVYTDTEKHILKEDNIFYNKETIEKRITNKGISYHVHFIEIESLEELLLFVNSIQCKSIVLYKGSWILNEEYYTIEIYDGYRE